MYSGTACKQAVLFVVLLHVLPAFFLIFPIKYGETVNVTKKTLFFARNSVFFLEIFREIVYNAN